jgi:hypothetical protein
MKAENNKPLAADLEVDRVLCGEESLLPSSGFLAAVMERVEEEAAAPEPIPFPWKRMLLSLLLVVTVCCWGGYELGRAWLASMQSASAQNAPIPAVWLNLLQETGWVGVALGLSLLSWLLVKRLTRRGELL